MTVSKKLLVNDVQILAYFHNSGATSIIWFIAMYFCWWKRVSVLSTLSMVHHVKSRFRLGESLGGMRAWLCRVWWIAHSGDLRWCRSYFVSFSITICPLRKRWNQFPKRSMARQVMNFPKRLEKSYSSMSIMSTFKYSCEFKRRSIVIRRIPITSVLQLI